MKNIFNKILITGTIALAGFCVSCDDSLDIDPESQTTIANFWLTNRDAASGVAAIYDGMQKYYGSKYYHKGEFRADNYITAGGSANAVLLELSNNTLTAGNSTVLDWTNLYLMIQRANLAINNIPNIPDFNESLLGEAHMLRAFGYFDAIRTWGDVPLFLENPTDLDKVQRPRTDANIILNEVILPDLMTAEKLISQLKNPTRFSLTSLWCLQAEVFMWTKDYTNAKIALKKIVDSNQFSLAQDRETWVKMFLSDSDIEPDRTLRQIGPELIFSLDFNRFEDNDAPGVYSLFFAGLPTFYISPELENKWIELFPIDEEGWTAKYPDFPPMTTEDNGDPLYGDWRYFDSRESGEPIGGARVAKYAKTNLRNDESKVTMYRYSDVLLRLAEIENIENNTEAAVALINQIRVARQLPTVEASSFTSEDELEDYILFERRIELFAEGKRWWDLRRTEKAIEVLGPINNMTEERLVYPIFFGHIDTNPKLKQNKGY